MLTEAEYGKQQVDMLLINNTLDEIIDYYQKQTLGLMQFYAQLTAGPSAIYREAVARKRVLGNVEAVGNDE